MPDKPSIYVIGDSISLQYGPHVERTLGGHFRYARKRGEAEVLLNLDEPRGANGGDSSVVCEFLAAVAATPAPPRYDMLLINCGLHDIKGHMETGERQVPIADYRANLPRIVTLARQLSDAFVWIRTTPVDDDLHARRGAGFSRIQLDVDRYNAVADEVMAIHGVPVLDLATFTAGLAEDGPIFQDGVHFTPDVQALQGALIAGWVQGWFAAHTQAET